MNLQPRANLLHLLNHDCLCFNLFYYPFCSLTNVNGRLVHVTHLPFYQRLLAHCPLAGKRSSGIQHTYFSYLGTYVSAKGAGFGSAMENWFSNSSLILCLMRFLIGEVPFPNQVRVYESMNSFTYSQFFFFRFSRTLKFSVLFFSANVCYDFYWLSSSQ